MAWGKVDDRLWGSPKWLATPPRGRALWATALSWCMDQLTDGHVPKHVLPVLGGTNADAKLLVTAGLWHEAEDGWVFHDWLDYQPSREQVHAERAAAAERQRRARERARESRQESRRDGSVTHGTVTPAVTVPPTRPDPTRPHSSSNDEEEQPLSEVATATPRPDVEALLDHLDQRLRENGAKVPNRTKRNRDAARLLIDSDGCTPEQVRRAIDWATSDEFWRSNILSMSKLREKYDQLRLAAQRGHPGRPGVATGTARAQIALELAAQYEAQEGARRAEIADREAVG